MTTEAWDAVLARIRTLELRDPPAGLKAYGKVSGAAALSANSFGIASIAHPAAGRFEIVWSVPFTNTNHVVVATLDSTVADLHISVTAAALGQIEVRIQTQAGVLTDDAFTLMAVGDQQEA